MTTPREKKVRDGVTEAVERENIQRATVVMSPEEIATLWARVVREKGAGSSDALALSEALDWRHPDPEGLREAALKQQKETE